MLIFLKIAWRNLLRNKWRSAITISAVAIGFTSLIFIRAFVDGADSQMVENYTDLLSGHIQIHKQGFQKNMGLQRNIPSVEKIVAILKNNREVTAFSARIKEFVLISSTEHSSGVLLLGVDPEGEPRVSHLHKRIHEGKFLGSDKDIVIGKSLADTLNVKLHDKVVIMAQAFDGSLASEAYRISGFLDTGAEEIDQGIVLITLKAAQELFVLDNRVSEVVIRTTSVKDVGPVTAELKKALNDTTLEVLNWKEISPMLQQWVEFDIAFINLILLIVLLVVAAGILNTLLMGILERTREFGIMLALGTKRRQIILMVALESLILGLTGIAAGYAVGSGLAAYFGVKGINLASFSNALNNYYTGSVIYTRLSLGYMLRYGLVVLIISMLVSIYPAWRAANLKPVDAIRS